MRKISLMSFLCYILHDDDTEEEARVLEQFLARPGTNIGSGTCFEPCTVLLSLVELPADICKLAAQSRAIIIPLIDAHQADPSPSQWVASIINKKFEDNPYLTSTFKIDEIKDFVDLLR